MKNTMLHIDCAETPKSYLHGVAFQKILHRWSRPKSAINREVLCNFCSTSVTLFLSSLCLSCCILLSVPWVGRRGSLTLNVQMVFLDLSPVIWSFSIGFYNHGQKLQFCLYRFMSLSLRKEVLFLTLSYIQPKATLSRNVSWSNK